MTLLTQDELQTVLPLLTVFIFMLGTCIGSFLNVVVCRIPRGQSVVSPPSHCPKCDSLIKSYDNIPILSWLLLRGRCRHCHEPISIRYPLVELSTALLFLAVWWRVNALQLPYRVLPGWLFLTAVLMAVTLTDLEFRLIPDKITYTGIVVAILLAILLPGGRVLWDLSAAGTVIPVTASDNTFASSLPALARTPRIIAPVSAILCMAIAWAGLAAVRAISRFFWGEKKFCSDLPLALALHNDSLIIGDQTVASIDNFLHRPGDCLRARVQNVSCSLENGDVLYPNQDFQETIQLQISRSQIQMGDLHLDRRTVTALQGETYQWSVPREVLGGGDIKLVSMIAAFLGLAGMLFTLLLSSLTGLAAGVVGLIVMRKHEAWAIPYGPYLALGALFWMLFGPNIWRLVDFFLLKIL